MAYIKLDESLPGMRALLAFRPDIASAMQQLMQTLMRSNQGLSMVEREQIGTLVSELNKCEICSNIHGEVAKCLIDKEQNSHKIINDLSSIKNKRLKAIFSIATGVQVSGMQVSTAQIKYAKNQGLTDIEIHDIVLISAMFCMFNRYIDGLGLKSYDTDQSLKIRAKMIASLGY
jgi:uncharacterized peroxidase-related enzyme